MPKTLKNTRIKGVPAKVQLTERDNTTASYYSTVFDDRNTIIFGEEVTINAGYNIDINNAILSESNPNRGEYESDIEFTGSLRKGIADKFIQYPSQTSLSSCSCNLFDRTYQHTPFVEDRLPAADAKQQDNIDSFFATGSSGIPGLGEPLWSKTKFEIDLTTGGVSGGPLTSSLRVAISQSVELDTSDVYTTKSFFISSSFDESNWNLSDEPYGPMGYYNFSKKYWQPIGRGMIFGSDNDRFVDDTTVKENDLRVAKYGTLGFTPGMVNLPWVDPRNLTASDDSAVLTTSVVLREALPKKYFEYHKAAGQYVDQWGFPFAAKYHASEDHCFNVSNIIDRPFVLEKAVVVFDKVSFTGPSGSIPDAICDLTGVLAPYTVTNFFILNQRGNANFTYNPNLDSTDIFSEPYRGAKSINEIWTVPTRSIIDFDNQAEKEITTSRDLLGYASIVAYTKDFTSPIERISVNKLGGDFEQLPFVSGNFDKNQPFLMTHFIEDINDFSTTGENRVLTFFTESIDNPVQEFFSDRETVFSTEKFLSNSFSGLDWEKENLTINFAMSIPGNTRNNLTFNDPFCHGSGSRKSYLSSDNGGRNGLGSVTPCGRDFSFLQNPVASIQDMVLNFGQFTIMGEYNTFNSDSFRRKTPYILLPEDKLIFGWQLPIPSNIDGKPINYDGSPGSSLEVLIGGNNTIGNTWLSYLGQSGGNEKFITSTLSISGPAKITLYGTYLDELPDEDGTVHNKTERSRRNLSTNAYSDETIEGK